MLPGMVDRTLTPGAAISVSALKAEKDARQRNAPVTAQIAPGSGSNGTHSKDHFDGPDQIIYLGNWGYGDVFDLGLSQWHDALARFENESWAATWL